MDENQNPISNSPRKYLTAKEKFTIVKEQLTTKTGVTETVKSMALPLLSFIGGRSYSLKRLWRV